MHHSLCAICHQHNKSLVKILPFLFFFSPGLTNPFQSNPLRDTRYGTQGVGQFCGDAVGGSGVTDKGTTPRATLPISFIYKTILGGAGVAARARARPLRALLGNSVRSPNPVPAYSGCSRTLKPPLMYRNVSMLHWILSAVSRPWPGRTANLSMTAATTAFICSMA